MRGRLLLGAVGVAGAAYGAWLLLAEDFLAAGVWLAAGVVLHDFVVVPLTLVLCWLGMRLAPARGRAPLAVALVVLGSLTLLAVPVLGGWGANTDNPTILDRDYVRGWLVVAALTAAGALAGLVVRLRRARPAR